MGILKEVNQKTREENITSKEQTMKNESKLEVSKPKSKKSIGIDPSSGPPKLAKKPKYSFKPSVERKRKRGKARVFIHVDDEENESDEVVKEVKAKAAKATKVVEEKQSGGAKHGKKSKSSKFDVILKQRKFSIVPPITLDEIVNEVVKNGNLKLLEEW